MFSYLLGSFILGFLCCFVFSKCFPKFDGLFIVDDSDEEKTRWILDMKNMDNPENIRKKKRVNLKVCSK